MKTQEINIAEILKDCPKGTELYSTVYGKVILYEVCDDGSIDTSEDEFLYNGCLHEGGECVLFPSKDQRDWSKFELPVLPPFDIKRVEKNGVYYYVKIDCSVGVNNDTHSFDNHFDCGNYFNSKEQAEYAAQKVKEFLLSLRKDAE